MSRYKIIIEYNGSKYAGWQRQNDAPSVQEAVETALLKFANEPCEITGAGRTDAGVHAMAQVAHFDCSKILNARNIVLGLNFHLIGNAISVIYAEPVADDFHARFSATKRGYTYRILNRSARPALDFERVWHVPVPLDIGAMNEAAEALIGNHDFTSFRSTMCQAKSPVKTLDSLEVVRVQNEIIVTTSARSFLHNQVRIMVGALKLSGEGKWTTQKIQEVLTLRDRTLSAPTAPAHGLYLSSVRY